MATTGKRVQYQLNSSLSAVTAAHTSQHSTQYHTHYCSNCKSTTAYIVEDTQHGNRVCTACGTVLSALIDTGTEWRTYPDSSDSINRLDGYEDPLLADMGLSTVIGRSDNSNHLARTQFNSTVSTRDTYVLQGFKKCDSIAHTLILSKSVVNRTKQTFKRSVDINAFKPSLYDCVITACISISCQQEHVSRSLTKFCRVANLPYRNVKACLNKIHSLRLHIQ